MQTARVLVWAAALFLSASCAAASQPSATIALSPDTPVAFTAQRPERPLLGANFRHLDETAPLTAAHEAGLDLIRSDLFWSEIEHDGRFDFSEYDAALARLERAHLHALFILDYFHPDHRADELGGYVRFASAAAAHFRGRGVVWEIFNEPDVREAEWHMQPVEFARMVREAALAIHAADPNARVISGGLSWINIEYAQAMFAEWDAHSAPAIVGFGVHPYHDGPPESAYEDLSTLALAMHEHTAHFPLWSTEWGYGGVGLDGHHASNGHSSANRAEQGALAARMALTAWQGGVDGSIWYELRDENDDGADGDGNFGLLDAHAAQKPAMQALTALTHETQGMHLLGPLDQLPDGVHALKFESADRIMIALWCAHPNQRVAVSVEVAKFSGAKNMLGAEVAVSGALSLSETDGPLYLSWRR